MVERSFPNLTVLAFSGKRNRPSASTRVIRDMKHPRRVITFKSLAAPSGISARQGMSPAKESKKQIQVQPAMPSDFLGKIRRSMSFHSVSKPRKVKSLKDIGDLLSSNTERNLLESKVNGVTPEAAKQTASGLSPSSMNRPSVRFSVQRPPIRATTKPLEPNQSQSPTAESRVILKFSLAPPPSKETPQSRLSRIEATPKVITDSMELPVAVSGLKIENERSPTILQRK